MIAEATDNRIGVTGLAFGARIMPVRVLDSQGEGEASTIAEGVYFAARHGARVINLSLEFSPGVTASDIPELIEAIRYADHHGVLVVAAAGNEGRSAIAYPARAPDVVAVGATTEHGCLAAYSNDGAGLTLVAPGGGGDADLPGDPHCHPEDPPGADIYQETFTGSSYRQFGLPSGYEGTSMATPHVAATAALIIASRVLGPHPTPAQLTARLRATARRLGGGGDERLYGAGLVDAAAATAPGGPGALAGEPAARVEDSPTAPACPSAATSRSWAAASWGWRWRASCSHATRVPRSACSSATHRWAPSDGHNSGVIHAGVYYQPGSLKARLCVEGARETVRVPRRAGNRQRALRQGDRGHRAERARTPGRAPSAAAGPTASPDCAHRPAGIEELEPHARGIAGLHSPGTGIADFAAVGAPTPRTCARRGGTVATSCAGHRRWPRAGARCGSATRAGSTEAAHARLLRGRVGRSPRRQGRSRPRSAHRALPPAPTCVSCPRAARWCAR